MTLRANAPDTVGRGTPDAQPEARCPASAINRRIMPQTAELGSRRKEGSYRDGRRERRLVGGEPPPRAWVPLVTALRWCRRTRAGGPGRSARAGRPAAREPWRPPPRTPRETGSLGCAAAGAAGHRPARLLHEVACVASTTACWLSLSGAIPACGPAALGGVGGDGREAGAGAAGRVAPLRGPACAIRSPGSVARRRVSRVPGWAPVARRPRAVFAGRGAVADADLMKAGWYRADDRRSRAAETRVGADGPASRMQRA